MSNTANTATSTATGAPVKKRLTTSAMIASIASEGQATRSAPFGHALRSAGRPARGHRRSLG